MIIPLSAAQASYDVWTNRHVLRERAPLPKPEAAASNMYQEEILNSDRK